MRERWFDGTRVYSQLRSHRTMTALPAELRGLPLDEKLDLIGLLWDEIRKSPEGFTPPDWHGTVVSERLAEYRSGKIQSTPLDDRFREWQKDRNS